MTNYLLETVQQHSEGLAVCPSLRVSSKVYLANRNFSSILVLHHFLYHEVKGES
jgi:hypothetical protein